MEIAVRGYSLCGVMQCSTLIVNCIYSFSVVTVVGLSARSKSANDRRTLDSGQSITTGHPGQRRKQVQPSLQFFCRAPLDLATEVSTHSPGTWEVLLTVRVCVPVPVPASAFRYLRTFPAFKCPLSTLGRLHSQSASP